MSKIIAFKLNKEKKRHSSKPMASLELILISPKNPEKITKSSIENFYRSLTNILICDF